MPTRRTLFRLGLAGLLAQLTGLPGPAAGRPARPARGRRGRIHLVDGWLLTDADLRRLGLNPEGRSARGTIRRGRRRPRSG